MRRNLLVLAALVLVPVSARADVKPHALCADGMVLQQKAKVKIWGTADKGEKVTVTFRDEKASAQADSAGRWIVTLPSGEAGGPFPMTIAGNNTLQYKDVLVGEVWVCSGQSNMEWSVDGCDEGDKKSAKSQPANPNLRMFNVGKKPWHKPLEECGGSWVIARPETVGGFSAVGYFFGRDLNNSLKVPVGMLHTSWGGTRAEAWTSIPILSAASDYKNEVAGYQAAVDAHVSDPMKSKSPVHANAPAALYNGMVYPILNCTIKGAIWYQGESNAGKAYHYRTLFPMMINNWRADFKQGDFPFYFVQLAPFTAVQKAPGESDWAELREAQTMTLKLPNTGQAVITDFGNEYDIHPTPKQPVGQRLALIARAKDYGEKIVYSGPIYKDMKVEGSKAVISFTSTGKGLVSKALEPTLARKDKKGNPVGAAWRVKADSSGASLVGWTICGEDKKFHDAKAEIVGDTVVVSSEAVTRPVAVRFGWANHPLCNLFNVEGLPANPFRTDDFRGKTAPKQP